MVSVAVGTTLNTLTARFESAPRKERMPEEGTADLDTQQAIGSL
jgi:hypothetical protein